jgi:hypothetical protein
VNIQRVTGAEPGAVVATLPAGRAFERSDKVAWATCFILDSRKNIGRIVC